MKKHMLASFLLIALAGCAQTEEEKAATTEVTSSAPLAIGQTGKADGIDFTVTEVDARNSLGPSQLGMVAGEGETYVIARYTLKNTGSAPLGIMERPAITLVDGNGQTYAADDVASAMLMAAGNNVGDFGSDLNPNVSASTAAAWKIDKAAFEKGDWTIRVATDPTLTFAVR